MLIQTPKGMYLYIPNIINNKFYRISFYINQLTSINRSFVNKIITIENFIKKQSDNLIKLSNIKRKHSKFISCIKYNANKTKAYMNLNIQMYQDKPIVSIFDKNKKLQDLNYILPQSSAINIVYLKNIWIKDNKMGLNWIMLQTKIYLPILKINECLIVEDEEELQAKYYNSPKENQQFNLCPESTNSKFSKFVNMNKFGVPNGPIEIELKKIGLTLQEFLDYNQKQSNTQGNIQQHTEIYSKPNNPIINVMDIHSVKLKKCKKKKKTNNKDNQVSNSYRPPSSTQLQDMIKNLKSSKKKKKLFT